MRVGIGLYRHMLTGEGFRYAAQLGVTDAVVHLTDYGRAGSKRGRVTDPWGVAGRDDQLWSYDQLRALIKLAASEGVAIAALENFDPGHWYDVLLDGPRRTKQLDGLKRLIADVGRAGIPAIGYYFALAGPWGQTSGRRARGRAESLEFDVRGLGESPIPNGQVWNMVYDQNAIGEQARVDGDALWNRLVVFLEACVPVAAEAGVRLAAHPDDPPVSPLRATPRLLTKPEDLDRLLAVVPSRANALEFCQGTVSEMLPGVEHVYRAIERHASNDSIAYVHFRNVQGAVPRYHEEFVDSGKVNPIKALRLYRENGYEGVVIPDHTPLIDCAAPWEAGMAYAVGFLRAALQASA